MHIFDQPDQMAYQVARRIASLIEEHQAVGKDVVLGLPTGSIRDRATRSHAPG